MAGAQGGFGAPIGLPRETSRLRNLRYYRAKFDPLRARPFRGDSSEFETWAADGTRIAGSRLARQPQSGERPERGLAFLVVHGLFAHRRIPALQELAESLTRFGPVWTMDLRGHGASGGACTLGEAEALDVAAVAALIRSETDLPLATIGFSMGAAAVVRSAALLEPTDAVVSISGPAEWDGRLGPGARKVALVWRVPGGIAAAQALTGVRLSRQIPASESPAAAAARIAPAPLLVIHGTEDPFFRTGEARLLYERAADPKALWVIPGGGHAEELFSSPGRVDSSMVDDFAGEIVRRLLTLRVGSWPGWEV
jgi:alpha-beta hydrolase superfamily lysophospholipase